MTRMETVNRICRDDIDALQQGVEALWRRGKDGLCAAKTEIEVDVEAFAAHLAETGQRPSTSQLDCFYRFLAAERYPHWERTPGSVLNDMVDWELLLAFAFGQVAQSRYFLDSGDPNGSFLAADAFFDGMTAFCLAKQGLKQLHGGIVQGELAVWH